MPDAPHVPPAGPADETHQGFNFSTFFIRNPVTTIIIMMILTLLGMRAFTQMPLELFPNIEYPVVVVQTVYPGAAPSEIETLVTKPIEDSIAGINGLDKLISTSRDGMSQVTVQMKLGVSSKDAASDVRDKVSGILYKLPKDAKPPAYLTFSSSTQPICNYAVSGPMSSVALSTYVKNVLKPKLESVPGVAQLQLLGNVERTYEVSLDPERLQTYNLNLPGVFQSIQAENYNLPGGKVPAATREMSLRTMGKFRTLDELSAMTLTTPTGAQVKLQDLGTVRDTIKDPMTYSAIDGQDAIFLSLVKQTDANAVTTVEEFDRKIDELRKTFPKGLTITKAADTTHYVKMSNEAVWEHLAIGAVLAVIVLFLFLRNVAAMLISGLAIPLSIIAAFVPMQLLGFTFNNLTTLALSLVVGILVDDAVVDLENIYRHLEAGEEPIKAAIQATGEIQLAVTATTMTIVGVFLPMSFMSGFIGKFFKSFGLTVTFAVLFSLLIARTLTPMMCAYLLKVKPTGKGLEEEGAHVREGRYAGLLRWSLRHRWAVMLLALVTFVGGMSLSRFIQKGFLTNSDRGEFLLRVQMPKGTALEETARVANMVAREVKKQEGVEHVYTLIGAYGTVDDARLDVLLVDQSKRKRRDSVIAAEVRKQFSTFPDAKVLADELGAVGGANNKPVDVQLQGDDLGELRRYAMSLATLMKDEAVFADLETSIGEEKPELRIVPDRVRMAQSGVMTASLANTLRLATTGDTPSTISAGDQEVDVWVRLQPSARRDVGALSSLAIATNRGGSVPLGSIADVEMGGGFSQVERQNRQRLVHVTANLMPGTSVGTATDLIKAKVLPKAAIPDHISISMDGQAKQQADAFGGFGQAMLMGVSLIFFILALQFSSFLTPLTIMFSLPLAIIGAFLGLLIFGKELGMMALIGIIMLMGIVTKNAILIVDFIITQTKRGVPRTEAVITAANVRLRPILMTTAAMVLGMAPMALGLGSGSEFRSPMAVVVIGGLLTSTALTLLVVPVGYTLMDDLRNFTFNLFRRGPKAPTGPSAGTETEKAELIPAPVHAVLEA